MCKPRNYCHVCGNYFYDEDDFIDTCDDCLAVLNDYHYINDHDEIEEEQEVSGDE